MDSEDLGPASVDELISEGIAAAKAGDRDRARTALMQAVELDETRLSAWLWLSDVVDTLEDREVCLENVLALDPGHEAAQRGLAHLRRQREWEAPRDSGDHGRSTPKPLWVDPPDPLLCPYCATQTASQDHKCPACGGALWQRVRRRETRSIWLWNLMVARMALTLLYALAPVAALTYVAYDLIGEYEPLLFVPVYLGLPSQLSTSLSQAALRMMPRVYVVAPLFLAAVSGALLVGMALRWKPVFFALLGASALRLALAVYAAVMGGYYGLVCGSGGVLVVIGSFLLVMQVQDDFWSDRKRVYFGLDKRSSAAARFQNAQALAEQGMWALAALYLRAGIAKVPRQIGGHLRLAHAYMQLNKPDLARQAIVTAQGINPADPRVAELLAALEGDDRS